MDKTSTKHIVSISLVLVTFWLMNSGHYSLLLLSLGGLSVALVVVLVHRMDVIDAESQPSQLSGKRLPGYYLWLGREIIYSNMDVVKRIWRGNKAISPCARWIRISQSSDMGKVIYANSVTLTPGTVAMDIEGDRLYVHALTEQALAALDRGDMDRRVTALER